MHEDDVSMAHNLWTPAHSGDLDFSLQPCPPESCPLVGSTSKLPAMPFEAEITADGKCKCLEPQVCDE